MPTVWQISGGSANRRYVDVFLRHGVALLGPGDPGPWSASRYNDDWSIQDFVRRFAEKAVPGDVILLRTGLARIHAIGIIDANYAYLHQFDDVNGWDLQHTRRVRWFALPVEYSFDAPVFGANPTRFTRVQNPIVIDYVNRFLNSPPTDWQHAPLPPLPPEEPPLQTIPGPLRDLVGQALDYAPLVESPHGFGDRPPEDEIVAHFVVPFFRALGWPAERIAIKWRCIDVALFKALPRIPQNCVFVIEAKRIGSGVEGAFDQAKGYADELGSLPNIVVTDGLRFRLYDSQSGYAASAYANLTRLKASAVRLFEQLRHT